MSTTREPVRPTSVNPQVVGEKVLPGGRRVWWTGKLAIGLRYQPTPCRDVPVSQSALWIQTLLLGSRRAINNNPVETV